MRRAKAVPTPRPCFVTSTVCGLPRFLFAPRNVRYSGGACGLVLRLPVSACHYPALLCWTRALGSPCPFVFARGQTSVLFPVAGGSWPSDFTCERFKPTNEVTQKQEGKKTRSDFVWNELRSLSLHFAHTILCASILFLLASRCFFRLTASHCCSFSPSLAFGVRRSSPALGA